MFKNELLKKCADFVADIEYNDWSELPDFLFELGYNCQELASYVEDADDKGYEQIHVYRVESLPGVDFMHFHFAIAYGAGGWSSLGISLHEVTPYVTTRYKFIKNWTDDD